MAGEQPNEGGVAGVVVSSFAQQEHYCAAAPLDRFLFYGLVVLWKPLIAPPLRPSPFARPLVPCASASSKPSSLIPIHLPKAALTQVAPLSSDFPRLVFLRSIFFMEAETSSGLVRKQNDDVEVDHYFLPGGILDTHQEEDMIGGSLLDEIGGVGNVTAVSLQFVCSARPRALDYRWIGLYQSFAW